MCGFVGWAWQAGTRPRDAETVVEKMLRLIHHRGPDSSGSIACDFAEVGFRRLSIIDVESGDQPVWNEARTIGIFLNGEIYNHRTLRRDLEQKGHSFRSHSDAEVLPHLYEEHGLDFVQHLNGMFAICVCDLNKRTIALYRDRTGIKPLFYATTPQGVVFGSELKPLLASGLTPMSLNRQAILPYITRFACPGDTTLVEGVHKLLPGHWMVISDDEVNRHRYYQIPLPGQDAAQPVDLDATLDLLRDAVGLQLVADVPVGISLSGGIDSSLIALCASQAQVNEVQAFTISFPDTPEEELACARAVAGHCGIEHFVLSATHDDFSDNLARTAWFTDEPVADPAFYSSMQVALSAASHVKVLLSGTGGDELYAGYGHYALARRESLYLSLPSALRGSDWLQKLVERQDGWADALDGYKASRLLWHSTIVSHLSPRDIRAIMEAIPDSLDPFSDLHEAFEYSKNSHPLDQQLYADVTGYLPDQLLSVLDRSTMAASIEGRVPFLDHRFIEQAFQTNGAEKLGAQNTLKFILKKLAADNLPDEVVSRVKLGFPNPVQGWISAQSPSIMEKLAIRPGSELSDALPAAWVTELCAAPALNWKSLYAIVLLQVWIECVFRQRLDTPPDIGLEDLFGIAV